MITGYAAFLDVMGFSSLVASERHGDRIANYLECLKHSLDIKDAEIEYIVFSDSIVVTTADDNDSSLQKLIQGCSSAFGSFLNEEIPVRGSIAHGTYIRETTPTGTFAAGRAIVEAYQFEARQNWCGIMLCPSVRQKVPDLSERCVWTRPGKSLEALELENSRLPWTAYLQPCDGIPFHGSGPEQYRGLAIVPTNGQLDPAQLYESLGQSIKSLIRLISIAPDPKAQEKYRVTQAWLEGIRANWFESVRRREWIKANVNARDRA